MYYRSHPGSSGLWRRDRVCQGSQGADARGCVRIVRSGQKGHIDANGVMEGKPAEAGRGVNWAGSYCDGVADE